MGAGSSGLGHLAEWKMLCLADREREDGDFSGEKDGVICLFFSLSRVRTSRMCLCAHTWPGSLLLDGAGHFVDASLGLMSTSSLCFDQSRAPCRSRALSSSPPPL